MATTFPVTVILDDRLHRTIVLGTEICGVPDKYSLVAVNNPSSVSPSNPNGDQLIFTDNTTSPATVSTIAAGGLQQPPVSDYVVVNPIDPDHQVFTTFHDNNSRVITFRRNLSTQTGYRVLLTNEPDTTLANAEKIMVATDTALHLFPAGGGGGGTKIPPVIGE